MTDPDNSTDTSRNSSCWLWLSTLTMFAFFALSGDRPLLASGMLLLAVFSFYNNPLDSVSPQLAKASQVLLLSWICGLVGVVAVILAAASNLR